MKDFREAALYEHRFWLQVLGDHGRFLHESLAPVEQEEIETAKYFINTFDRLLERVETTDLIHLSMRADEEAKKIREFKLDLIAKMLTGNVKIHLGPTFVNHMVNEVEEYIRVLEYLKRGEVPPVFHELHHHTVWLLDAAGHAGAIQDNMDQVEKRLKAKSEKYMKSFEDFYLKAVEMTGYLRTNLTSFPALQRMNAEVSLEIQLFMKFLDELKELELTEQALGSFAPLMADHMFREECYYLSKVAEAAQLSAPDCDPGKPRLEEN
ncbi:DUF2935 domain-containing protein [Mesobacillus subterraneus]|uniref:DUF2935 domain-containing protein n=1 Tax=Mesobacillus subterraneus TaxID=285983 RepID=A0A3R9E4Y1_9BACI|nr:DUF2935 domain-containing protein [Mesobacillus subterraneus]RSD26206.1 DUF2935 domain-containing protein [Mesobacillus subterraneus]